MSARNLLEQAKNSLLAEDSEKRPRSKREFKFKGKKVLVIRTDARVAATYPSGISTEDLQEFKKAMDELEIWRV